VPGRKGKLRWWGKKTVIEGVGRKGGGRPHKSFRRGGVGGFHLSVEVYEHVEETKGRETEMGNVKEGKRKENSRNRGKKKREGEKGEDGNDNNSGATNKISHQGTGGGGDD